MLEAHILSGGVDSTSVLYRRLTDTTNEIHVLHVLGGRPSDVAHTKATRTIAVWCAKAIRHFTYVEAAPIRLPGRPCNGSLFAQCGFLLGEYIVRNPAIGLVVQGCNGGPEDQSKESLFRNDYREGVCNAVCNGYAPAPQWLYPNFDLPKTEAFRLMPGELQDLCWTCPTPRQNGSELVPCGTCLKCQEFKAMKEALK